MLPYYLPDFFQRRLLIHVELPNGHVGDGAKKANLMTFSFQPESGQPCMGSGWSTEWEPKYPSEAYDEKQYASLIMLAGVLSSEDFILMGRWKDSAWTERKWRPNVAIVAFPAWMDASIELPGVIPICDSRVRTAIRRLCSEPAPERGEWYLKSYIPIFEELAVRCSASSRSLDKALFAYGR